MNSQKTQGFFLLLVFVWLGTFFLNDNFAGEFNSGNLIRYCSMFGIIGIGVMFVIVTGGIDLSIGSTIGLIGASLVLLLRLNPIESLKPLASDEQAKIVWFFWILIGTMVAGSLTWLLTSFAQKNFRLKKLIFPSLFLIVAALSFNAMWIANSDADNTSRIPWIFFLLFAISINIGLLHGVLITKFQLQSFVVTLGGLLCYRGVTRWLTDDSTQGLGSDFENSLRLLAKGKVCTVSSLMCFAGFAVAIYFGLRWMTRNHKESGHRNLTGVVLGLIGGIIGSSRFWNGFERTDFQVLFDTTIFGFIPANFSTWKTVVSDVAAARPQWLMSYAWIPMIPIGLWMLVRLIVTMRNQVVGKPSNPGLQDDSRANWTSQLRWLPADFFWFTSKREKHHVNFLIVSLAGLVVSILLLRQAYLVSEGVVQLDVSEKTLWGIRLASVYASLAFVMISIARLGRCIERHGDEIAKFCFPIVGLLAVLSVLGTTKLPTTQVQTPFFIMLLLAAFAMIIFDRTVFGRYLLAIGNNEDAARFSGIDTEEVTVAAYVICSGIIGIAATIFMLESNSVAPTGFGSFYELYAIAAVVLGGCSLRGGEANVIGVLLGASIMRVLANAPDMINFPKTLEYTILGLVIVVGVIVDDRIRRRSLASSGDD